MKTISKHVSFLAALCVAGSSLWADPQKAVDPTTQELLDEVRALRAEVKELRVKVAAPQSATQPASLARGAAAASEPAAQDTADRLAHDAAQRDALPDTERLTAGYRRDQGFLIRSEDGNFLLHPWAFIQIRNATNYSKNATATTSDTQNGFELPRMKFLLDGNVFSPDLTYQFIWATSDTTGNLGLQDAWARYHIPNTPFAFRAGQIRDPVDHEQIIYATKSLTPGRSIVNNVLLNGDDIAVKANTDAKLLVMDGEPIAEPVVGHGPFVMNSRAEIQQAFEDYQLGKMGEIE